MRHEDISKSMLQYVTTSRLYISADQGCPGLHCEKHPWFRIDMLHPTASLRTTSASFFLSREFSRGDPVWCRYTRLDTGSSLLCFYRDQSRLKPGMCSLAVVQRTPHAVGSPCALTPPVDPRVPWIPSNPVVRYDVNFKISKTNVSFLTGSLPSPGIG